ncbi:MAG: VWA domain-containing protein [Anaerolineae bacterium]|nr:VWA domain-containing protein [Anaerolineae bacterium]
MTNGRNQDAAAAAAHMTLAVNAPYLPLTTQPYLVYLLVEIDDEAGGAALPVNLILVVDTSESMHIRLVSESQFEALARAGRLQEVLIDGVPAWQPVGITEEELNRLPSRMERVRDALRAVVGQLRPADQFALVAFASQAVTLVPSTAGAHKQRLLDAVQRLERLDLGERTHIAQGIEMGFAELQRARSPERVDRLLVLTDGFTSDEDACRDWARQARRARVPISTMGLGGDFNEELMIPIADQTGGEAYLLEQPEEIPGALARELQRAQAVRCRGLELKLRPASGVTVRAAHRVRPSIAPLEALDAGGSFTFPLGDLVAGDRPAALLELLVPPQPAGACHLAQVVLAYEDPARAPVGQKARADVTVQVTADPARLTEQVGRVMDAVAGVSAYKLQRKAQEDVAVGNVGSATRKLRAAATRLLDMGEAALAAEVEQQALELEQHGQVDPQRTKKVRYQTRTLMH